MDDRTDSPAYVPPTLREMRKRILGMAEVVILIENGVVTKIELPDGLEMIVDESNPNPSTGIPDKCKLIVRGELRAFLAARNASKSA
jgi:hypothetical protein